MASIINAPKDRTADYDYIAFSFNGKHSFEDFGIYRTSDSNSGYNETLTRTMTDKTAEVPGMDGQYYFGTQHKNKTFTVKFAFDNLTEEKLQQLKKWLNGKEIGDLWFAEAPHRVYSAKVTGNATVSALAFSINGRHRVYKGTGSVQFTCYYPYAHTPDKIRFFQKEGENYTAYELPGNESDSYNVFSNFKEIQNVLPYSETGQDDIIYGDLPFHFKAKLLSPFEEGDIAITMDKGGAVYHLSENTTYETE